MNRVLQEIAVVETRLDDVTCVSGVCSRCPKCCSISVMANYCWPGVTISDSAN